MIEDPARVVAVVAALEKVRAHVDTYDNDAELAPSAYNRWIGMLDEAADGGCANLLLDADPISASEYLMHIDAAIAFLKELL